jgi:hypothetical protein
MKKKSLLKEIINDREDICLLYSWGNEAKKEIQRAHDRHTHHINDHRANDLLPQFTALCKEVETVQLDNQQHQYFDDNIRLASKNFVEIFDRLQGIDGRLVFESKASRYNIGLLSELNAKVEDLKKRYDMMESADCANLDLLNKKMDCYSAELSQVAADTNKALLAIRQTNNVARECSNAQATEITNLKKEMEQLRKAARLQGEHIVELEKKYPKLCKTVGRPKKGE